MVTNDKLYMSKYMKSYYNNNKNKINEKIL